MGIEIEYIAQDYAIIFVRSSDKKEAAKEIANRIKNLKYDDGSKLSEKDINYILQLIEEFLSRKRIFKYKYGGYIVTPQAFDNESYLTLIDYILSQIKK
jgi:repressor of nif and glnA expression